MLPDVNLREISFKMEIIRFSVSEKERLLPVAINTAWKPILLFLTDSGSRCWFKRKASRKSRFVRLRSTARLKTFLGAINPNIDLESILESMRYRHKRGDCLMTEERSKRRWKFSLPRKIFERGRVRSGFWWILTLFRAFSCVTNCKLMSAFGTPAF